jgi:hypothetical protein
MHSMMISRFHYCRFIVADHPKVVKLLSAKLDELVNADNGVRSVTP